MVIICQFAKYLPDFKIESRCFYRCMLLHGYEWDVLLLEISCWAHLQVESCFTRSSEQHFHFVTSK